MTSNFCIYGAVELEGKPKARSSTLDRSIMATRYRLHAILVPVHRLLAHRTSLPLICLSHHHVSRYPLCYRAAPPQHSFPVVGRLAFAPFF